MSDKKAQSGSILSPRMRLCCGAMIMLAVILLMGGAASVPFFFESSSMLYKFGMEKALLRTGKVLGIIAGSLVLLQLALASRLKFLDRIFALNTLLNVHRVIGILIGLCVIIHPVLIFYPEDTIMIPLAMRYWPEFAGVFLLVVILSTVMTARWRLFLRISFDRWWILHRVAVLISAAALFVHVLFVSDTFEAGAPRTMVFCAFGSYGLLYAWVKLRTVRVRQKPFIVSGVNAAGREAHAITIKPKSPSPDAAIIPYMPGQFCFIRLKSKAVSSEEHPFTIASSPSRPGSLEFVIRASGDWTRSMGRVLPGDLAFIDGPYGLFTHLRRQNSQKIVMIAGGIGITPMLSMLRYMADVGDQREIILIWSNRTREHIIFPDEFQEIKSRVPGLSIAHVITQEPNTNMERERLDQSSLEGLLSGCSRKWAMVFVCGPPQMIKDITSALVKIGFPRRSIFTERFSL